VLSGAGIIIENAWQGILRLFQGIELFVFLGYLKKWEKYISVHSIAFQTLWKEKLFRGMYPLPFGNLSPIDPHTPRNFSDPPWGGYGYFLESHIQRGS